MVLGDGGEVGLSGSAVGEERKMKGGRISESGEQEGGEGEWDERESPVADGGPDGSESLAVGVGVGHDPAARKTDRVSNAQRKKGRRRRNVPGVRLEEVDDVIDVAVDLGLVGAGNEARRVVAAEAGGKGEDR